jgi:hypothetical protein
MEEWGRHTRCNIDREASQEIGGDIRDVISIGKLVRKSDGPEQIDLIMQTMSKYGMEEYTTRFPVKQRFVKVHNALKNQNQ